MNRGGILNEDALRDYQQSVLDELHQVWRKNRSVMVQMPTGTGKTVLLAAVIREYAKKGVLVVAHRRELIEQISDTLDTFGVEHGIILAGQAEDGTKKVQVASIQTLSRRGCELNPSLVVVDEAHHALAETYRELWERWPEAKFLGLTATPCRLSGEPFTDLFDVLVQSWSVVEFIRKGWLSDVEYVSVRSDSVAMQKVASLNKRGADGDYQKKQMANVLDVPESIEHLYRSYRKYADGKKGIVYAINQQHARHIAEYYQEHGVNCCMIDSNTPNRQRKQWVEDYRLGRIDVLVNVDIFSSGFDCPEVEFIQLARPTLSLALYLQQIGRGMRISEGKSKVTILDQVGLWLVFGLPTTDWNWKDMFEGKVAGKGRLDYSTLGLQRGMGDEKTLVNEEMYRIQTLLSELGDERKGKGRAPEKGKPVTYGPNRLEIFKELGRYGLKRMGEVCLPPIYEEMERLWRNKKYFALALQPKERSGTREAWTVINKEGEDMNVRMIGEWVSTDDGIFEFRSKEEGRFVTRFYDVENNEVHTSRMEKIGGVCFFRSSDGDTYILRGDSAYKKRFRRDEVVYNDSLTIVGSNLFVKSDDNRHYKIAGYHGDCVIVKDGMELTEIAKDGSRGQALESMPMDTTEQPDFQLLGLQRETAPSAVMKFGRGNLPRDYQQEMLDEFWNTKRRRKRVLLQLPTGMGKMWMAMVPIREEMKMSIRRYYSVNKVLVVTHRQELMGQIAETLERCSIKPVIMRKGRFTDTSMCDTTLTSATFVENQLDTIDRYYEPTLIIIDEAHLIPKKVYDKLVAKWPDARIIGLTATPVSDDDLVLKKYFSQLVPSWSIKRLIAAGWMKDIDYVDEGVSTSADVERLYESYKKHADGRRGIVCAINEKHASHIEACYQRHGVKAAVCQDLNTLEGKQQVENLRNGNLKVLVEVKQFSDGFRCPEIEFVQLACPTRQLATYLHQVECGMRIEHQGTENAGSTLHHDRLIVLDHVGAKDAFGLPTDDRDWTALFEGVKPLASPSPAVTKWQLRMLRLLGDASGTYDQSVPLVEGSS